MIQINQSINPSINSAVIQSVFELVGPTGIVFLKKLIKFLFSLFKIIYSVLARKLTYIIEIILKVAGPGVCEISHSVCESVLSIENLLC